MAPIRWNGFHNVCPSLLKEAEIVYTALNSTEGKEGGIYSERKDMGHLRALILGVCKCHGLLHKDDESSILKLSIFKKTTEESK